MATGRVIFNASGAFIKEARAHTSGIALPNGSRNLLLSHSPAPVGRETIADPGAREFDTIPLFDYQMRDTIFRTFPPTVIPLRTPVTPVQKPIPYVIEEAPILGREGQR